MNIFTSFKFIRIDDINTKEIWKTKFLKNPKIEVYSHNLEGIYFFIFNR